MKEDRIEAFDLNFENEENILDYPDKPNTKKFKFLIPPNHSNTITRVLDINYDLYLVNIKQAKFNRGFKFEIIKFHIIKKDKLPNKRAVKQETVSTFTLIAKQIGCYIKYNEFEDMELDIECIEDVEDNLATIILHILTNEDLRDSIYITSLIKTNRPKELGRILSGDFDIPRNIKLKTYEGF